MTSSTKAVFAGIRSAMSRVARTPSPRRRFIAAGVYIALAVLGLVGTWAFNFAYAGDNYLADWFANPASSSAAVDIIVIAVVAAVYYFHESRQLGWRLIVPLLFTVVSVFVAVSFALPLFLGLRELRLRRLFSGSTAAH